MKQFLKIITFLIVVPTMILAKYHTVKSDRSFKELLNKYEYSVVCFAPSQADQASNLSAEKQENVRQDFKDVQNRMQAAAKSDIVNQQDIGFLLVDVAFNQASDLADSYKISKFPTCLVFDSDVAVKKSLRKVPDSASALVKMLQSQFGPEIKKLITNRKKDRNLRTQVQVPVYFEYGSYSNNWIPNAVTPYSRWGSGPYGVSYDMSGLQNL